MQNKAARLFNEGLAHHRANRLQEARRCYEQGLALNPAEADAHFLLGQLLFTIGEIDQAERTLYKALQIRPKEARYHHELGVGLFNAGQFEKACPPFKQAVLLEPDNPAYRHALALTQEQQNNYEEAILQWHMLRKHDGFGLPAAEHLAHLYLVCQQHEKALAAITDLLALEPDNASSYSLRANLYEKQGRYEEALADRRKAVTLLPEDALLRGQLALALMSAGQENEALKEFDASVRLTPENGQLHFNRGLAYDRTGHRETACQALGMAVQYTQDSHALVPVLISLANLYTDMGRYDEAHTLYQQAITLLPDNATAHFNLGMLHLEKSQRREAVASFEAAFKHDPRNGLMATHLAFQKMHLCQWEDLENLSERVTEAIVHNTADIPPFVVLSLPQTTPQLQYECAKNHSLRFPTPIPTPAKTTISHNTPHPRIRIAYLSSDFKNHATAYLMIEMLEAHDREKFEIFALSYGINDQSAMRTRIEKSVEHFIELCDFSEKEAVPVIAKLELDIMVDLKGYTQENCSRWLRYRLAPIQVSWLGYPGTLGAPWVDYLIADKVVAPHEHQWMYSEKLLHLPGSYQPVARNRECAARPTRKDELLPENALVLCSFNQTYKITSEVFSCWLRILQKVPHAVLWLWASNPWAEETLHQLAQAKGITPQRIIFAHGKSQAEHLARIPLADLAIDTFPCNGHTTTSDALWAGVPVITQQGEPFASRVAASLLAATGLTELITGSLSDYENCILRFCQDEPWRNMLREQTGTLRSESDFFDAPRFAKKLETLFAELYENRFTI